MLEQFEFAVVYDNALIGALLLFIVLAYPGGLYVSTQEVDSLRDVVKEGRKTPSSTASNGGNKMLETQNLTQTFGELVANNQISLEFGADSGEVVFIIGPNGAGKTTFVEMLAGNLTPTDGKILLDGKDITGTSFHDRVDLAIGKSFQIANIFEESTVRENLRMAALLRYGLTAKVLPFEDSYEHVENEVDEQLENFGLVDVADMRADKLSHGDRKILDVATAYALDLEYIFLDEPTAGVITEKKHELIETVLDMT